MWTTNKTPPTILVAYIIQFLQRHCTHPCRAPGKIILQPNGCITQLVFFAQKITVQKPTMGSRLKEKGLDLKGGVSSKPSNSPSNSKISLEISENLCWVVWGEEEKPETNVHFVIKQLESKKWASAKQNKEKEKCWKVGIILKQNSLTTPFNRTMGWREKWDSSVFCEIFRRRQRRGTQLSSGQTTCHITLLYGDYNKPWSGYLWTNQYN